MTAPTMRERIEAIHAAGEVVRAAGERARRAEERRALFLLFVGGFRIMAERAEERDGISGMRGAE